MNIKVKVDDTSLLLGFRSFKRANEQAIRNTLNKAAAVTRKESITQVKNNFTLRNQFTVRSISYDKATQTEIKNMQSRIGALKRASYLKQQEEGVLKRDRSRGGQIEGAVKKASAVPMAAARDYAESKPVSTLHYVQKIKRETVGRGKMSAPLLKKSGGTTKSRSVAQMYIGKKYGLYVKRDNNIFKVRSFSKVGRNGVKAVLEHIYSIHLNPIKITKSTWLEPSVRKASRNLEAVYKWELKKLWGDGKLR